jgi:hypothetical protein
MHKDMKRLVNLARQQGWDVQRQTKHWVVINPEGQPFPVPSSAEGRTYLNARAALRRLGLEVTK